MRKPSLVWIVDDSPTQASLTERALGADYQFERFADGAAAIERLAAARVVPEVVLLDWVMPGMSGDEVCRFVRSNPTTCEVPVVMLTASRTDTRDIVNAFESGANDYIAKPFVTEELRARVGTIVRAGRLKRVAERESRRVLAINQLSRALFEAGSDVEALVGELATVLAATFGDGCAIAMPGTERVVRHRAAVGVELLASLVDAEHPPSPFDPAALAPAYARYVAELGLCDAIVVPFIAREVADGIVLLTRDGESEPFDVHDLAAIKTCLELTGLAIEAAVRAETERIALRFQEQLIGIVSHDLRTPLGAMAMGIGMLRDAPIDHTASDRVLVRIDNSARRMTAIVEQLLDVTRARIGQPIPLARAPVDLLAVANDALDELRSTSPNASLELVGEPVHGAWDRDRLGQVISNLVSNAIYYGRPGAPIVVAVSRTDDTASVTVRNELAAAPIPTEQLSTLFDPFKRGESRKHTHGLGLGLYIVAEIVKAHGGAVGAISDARGTAFRVALPFA
jgi:signal transduction histidine kinase